MPFVSTPYALDALPWTEIAASLRRDARLILPSGRCDDFGPHLPLGAGTRLAEALADDLSREFRVLRAPTFHYGVNAAAAAPGTAGLRSKTLHRALNELLASWQDQGVAEFVLICGSAPDPHVETIATVSVQRARVRVVEPLTADLSEFGDELHDPRRQGEALTSLLLHLCPELVHAGPAPGDSPALVRASAERGKAMYRHIREKIRQRVFLPDASAAAT